MRLFILGATLLACVSAQARELEADICVYGGTSGGVAAAVQAARMGKSVILLESGNHLGGLTTGGLGATDIGNKAAIGGIAREFYQRLGRHYGTNEVWMFEPSVAKNTYIQMLREVRVLVHYQQRLAAVKKKRGRITEIRMENGNVVRAKMFIDATYEGDLMAKAGVSYTVGREANSKFGESLNGIRAHTPFHQFEVAVDPYVRRGEPKSGLLPFVQPGSGGKPGDGDHRVQAYNFRLCLTQTPTNRLPILPPKNYDENKYELFARFIEALIANGHSPGLNDFWLLKSMPNGKTDINNRGGFSTDFIGGNYEYPDADYEKRAQIWQAHVDYTRGFLHFLATSSRVPKSIRDEMQTWGLCRDEFTDNGGWMTQLYVREARRMISDYVMTEHNCRGLKTAEDSVGMGAYGMDSHNCQRIAKNGAAENEGDVQVHGFSPYPIAYRSIIPREKECANLLVPVCMAATHIAYGSIRMEPVFMVLGQSAATAAAFALDAEIPVQAVDYPKLKQRLIADEQVLEWTGPKVQLTVRNIGPSKLPGIVVDDAVAHRRGQWQPSTAAGRNILGWSYRHDSNTNKGNSVMTFTPNLPKSGDYEVLFWFQPQGNRATNVPVMVTANGKVLHRALVNQRKTTNEVVSLGTFDLPKGTGTTVTVSNEGTEGYVVADGVQFVPVR
jgi:hypothetical protein